MAKNKSLGVSPFTNTIYFGTLDTEKHMWIGQKTDVTEDAIAAVFEWFVGNMNDEIEEYKVSYPYSEFELAIRRRNNVKR